MKHLLGPLLIACLFLAACDSVTTDSSNKHPQPPPKDQSDGYILKDDVDNVNEALDYENSDLKMIYFAGGCFWGVEAYMQKIYGVAEVTSGYANGDGANPSYQDVLQGDQDFVEAVEVAYDPARVSIDTLIDRLFQVIDPTSKNQQGNDVGVQYRTGIYYTDKDEQLVVQNAVKKEQQYYEDDIVTEAVPLENFYQAEEMHQDYLDKNPNGYCHINLNAADNYPIEPIPQDQAIIQKLSQ